MTHMWHMSHIHMDMRHDSFICVPWLIAMWWYRIWICDMCHICYTYDVTSYPGMSHGIWICDMDMDIAYGYGYVTWIWISDMWICDMDIGYVHMDMWHGYGYRLWICCIHDIPMWQVCHICCIVCHIICEVWCHIVMSLPLEDDQRVHPPTHSMTL